MAKQPVEWVLVVYYGPEAHRAIYGRQVSSSRYTKDYIQLSRKADFIETVKRLFDIEGDQPSAVPLTYRWASGNAPGAFVFRSSDRPHLKWETRLGAPLVWKMSPASSDLTSETIPGDPSHLDFQSAENELTLLHNRGAGQPYLMAVKLKGEHRTLHLRTYLANPSEEYSWADIQLTPPEIQELAKKTSQRSALAWSVFQSDGVFLEGGLGDILTKLNEPDFIDSLDESVAYKLSNYLKRPASGLFFEPECNHDAWTRPAEFSDQIFGQSFDDITARLMARSSIEKYGDSVAETYETSVEQVELFKNKIEQQSYEIEDFHASVKTRGSAQKVFSDAVKANYGYRCAITNIQTKNFLIAAHIVPWSADRSIRLDPSNGICLSVLVDRAFEYGFLIIEDDLTIRINVDKIGVDQSLLDQFMPYEGQKINAPDRFPPKPEYLQRRRDMVI